MNINNNTIPLTLLLNDYEMETDKVKEFICVIEDCLKKK